MAENVLKISRQNTFQFDGYAVVNENTFTINKTNQAGNWVHNALNLGVDCGEDGINYVSGMGGYNPTRDNLIYLQQLDSDGKIMSREHSKTINWEDRFSLTDSDLALVPNQNKIRCYLEKEGDKTIEKVFVTMYDAIAYIKEHITDKMCIRVKGHFEYRPSEDGTEWYSSHVLDTISVRDPEYSQPSSKIVLTALIDTETFGKPNVEERNIPLFVKTLAYIGKVGDKKYNQVCTVPLKLLLDIDSFNIETEAGQNKFKNYKNNVFTAQKGEINEVGLICKYSGGAKKVEIKFEDLPKEIQQGITMGYIDQEEVMGKMAVAGKAEKNLVFKSVDIVTKTVDETTMPVIRKEEKKYKASDMITFNDLVPIEDNSSATSSNATTISNEVLEEVMDEDITNILNQFISGM